MNNDGIILYEAMDALFLARAIGIELNVAQRTIIILAAIMVRSAFRKFPKPA